MQLYYAGPFKRFLQRLLLRFVAFLLFIQLPAVELRPMQRNTSEARWINPCDLPGHLFDPDSDMIGAPNVNEAEVNKGLRTRTKISANHGKKLFQNFTAEIVKDSYLIDGTASHRLGWLPKVNRADVRRMSLRALIRFFYNILQYYAVGIEQIITDEVLYDGKFIAQCREVENHITQLLCQLHLASFMLRIRLSPDVTREVMKQEYRSGSRSQRLIRNFIIFRDYSEMLEIMQEAFENNYERTLLLSTTPFYSPLLDMQSYAVRK